MLKIFLKNSAIALLGFGLAGCGAIDRIEAIGQPPGLAPVGNPGAREIVAHIPQQAPISYANNSQIGRAHV